MPSCRVINLWFHPLHWPLCKPITSMKNLHVTRIAHHAETGTGLYGDIPGFSGH